MEWGLTAVVIFIILSIKAAEKGDMSGLAFIGKVLAFCAFFLGVGTIGFWPAVAAAAAVIVFYVIYRLWRDKQKTDRGEK